MNKKELIKAISSEIKLPKKQHFHIRESGIELLRIISIFFVVIIHTAPSFLLLK